MYHKLHTYFDKHIYREDYDPLNKGIHKDIREISAKLLIDDAPSEIEFVKKLSCKGYLTKPYRKNFKLKAIDFNKEYGDINGHTVLASAGKPYSIIYK